MTSVKYSFGGGELETHGVALLTPDEATNLASALLQWASAVSHGLIVFDGPNAKPSFRSRVEAAGEDK